MSPTAQSVVSEAMVTLKHVEIPPILQERIDQHKQNLMALASALLDGGQDADHVRDTIETVLESFKNELFRTVDSLMEDCDVQ